MTSKREVKKIKEKYNILVLGCGGTGTYFLKEFNHFIARNKIAQDMISSLIIADGDTVEEKNLDRQCFIEEDIGRNKACVFAEVLNDAMGAYNVSEDFTVRWESHCDYITDMSVLEDLLLDGKYSKQEDYSSHNQTLELNIPIIIVCVDNDAARLMCEEFFKKYNYCFLYDSGNEFSVGEVNFAHKLNGRVLSPEKSVSFPSMKNGDLRHVNELSCTELNEVAPQHFLVNMAAASHLLRGVVNVLSDPKKKLLIERIAPNLGFVFFDAFSGRTEFTLRKSDQAVI